jgi:hypothetical protein
MSAGTPGGRAGRWLMVAAIVAVVATVVAALLVMDPPSEQRAERLDAIRVEHLQLLSQRIDAHVEVQGTLPATLSEVASGPGDAVGDPVTGDAYGYESTGERGYRLCATFDTRLAPAATGMRDEWRHPAGHHCFERQARPVAGTRPK